VALLEIAFLLPLGYKPPDAAALSSSRALTKALRHDDRRTDNDAGFPRMEAHVGFSAA
jgi:hypothetical protein